MGKERTKVNAERKRQRFSREFKLEALRLLELGQKPGAQLALELGIRRNQLYKWQKELGAKGNQAFHGSGCKPTDEQSEVFRIPWTLLKVDNTC